MGQPYESGGLGGGGAMGSHRDALKVTKASSNDDS